MAMPKATIDKHGHLMASEHNIGTPTHPANGRHVDAVAQPPSAQGGTERQFGTGVATRDGLHPPPNGRRRGARKGSAGSS